MNISSIWYLVVSSSSVQMSLFQSQLKKADMKATLEELETDFGLPKISVYDYVVVGGGAAGCLIAGRLAESGYQVLLLEKGGDTVPAMMNPLLKIVGFHPTVNDNYLTVPQRHSWQSSGGVGSVSFGIMLGGSGAHNGYVYNRGSPEVYDEWAQILNDKSYGYENMLSLYKENEEMTGFLFSEQERELFYGTNGPFRVETDIPQDFGDWFATGRFLGFNEADPNAHLAQSFNTVQTSIRNGIRETSYTAFIRRRPNPNLNIFRFSNAQKVLIEERSAYGVVYLRHGITQIVSVNEEVILTSGSMVSPLLLLRSGIGPAALLEKAGIPCIVDLPGVGTYLEDHPLVKLSFNLQSPKIAAWNDSQVVTFLSSYPGGRGSTGTIGLQAYIRTSISPESGRWPDILIQYGRDFLDPSKAIFYVFLIKLESSGALWFNTTAIKNGETESSRIVQLDPNFFSHHRDMDRMIEGLDFLFNRILTSPYFGEKGFTLDGDMTEGCTAHLPNSKGFWKCFVEWRASAGWHEAGTCKMGKFGDPRRVVDTKFRVIGVDKLRVADASVFPKLPNTNTHAPTLAMAAKAVHAIRG